MYDSCIQMYFYFAILSFYRSGRIVQRCAVYFIIGRDQRTDGAEQEIEQQKYKRVQYNY